MVSSRWQKHNTARYSLAFLILVVTVFAIGYPASLLGLEGVPALIASAIGVIVGFVAAFALVKWRANAMVRVLKFDCQEIEREFRILFKDNNIQFNRKPAEDGYRYNFFGRNDLSMTIQSYSPFNRGVEDKDGRVSSATKITLGDLNKKNEAFAEQLADLIDEMANKLTK